MYVFIDLFDFHLKLTLHVEMKIDENDYYGSACEIQL